MRTQQQQQNKETQEEKKNKKKFPIGESLFSSLTGAAAVAALANLSSCPFLKSAALVDRWATLGWMGVIAFAKPALTDSLIRNSATGMCVCVSLV